jgi:hypothetical protein
MKAIQVYCLLVMSQRGTNKIRIAALLLLMSMGMLSRHKGQKLRCIQVMSELFSFLKGDVAFHLYTWPTSEDCLFH